MKKVLKNKFEKYQIAKEDLVKIHGGDYPIPLPYPGTGSPDGIASSSTRGPVPLIMGPPITVIIEGHP